LTNQEYEKVEKLAKKSGIPLSQCPTCLATKIEISPDIWGWENGAYLYHGERFLCDCEVQKALRKHYLLANIGDQYQRLSLDQWRGPQEIRETVETYLDRWKNFKQHGMGLEFASERLGVGKTFLACHVGKELIKLGENVYFTPFLEVISALSHEGDETEEVSKRMRDTTVLILDEVVPPYTQAQARLFAAKFEELIRHRQNYNMPTIMTTNLSPEDLHANYPRPYSLLEAKQLRIVLDGEDARQNWIAMENLELAMNGEVRPIS
jgi:DNA replication protein DnaC